VSNWPDHTPEPGESPRWWPWGVAAVAIVAIVMLSPGDDRSNASGRGWQMPDFTMPQITLPEFDFSPPSDVISQQAPTPSADVPAAVAAAMGDALANPDVPISQQQVPFETCLSVLTDSANALGDPILIEDTNDRRVGVFKFLEGDLTVTCSRTDGTMTVQQRP
jgi:hypothetical protein